MLKHRLKKIELLLRVKERSTQEKKREPLFYLLIITLRKTRRRWPSSSPHREKNKLSDTSILIVNRN